MKSITVKLFVLAVLFVSSACSKPSQSTKPPDVDYYTCTMHPSVHAEAPGKCPICGMDLVPVMKTSAASGKNATQSSQSSHAHAGHGGMNGMPGMSMGEMNNVPAGNPNEFVVPAARQQQIGV